MEVTNNTRKKVTDKTPKWVIGLKNLVQISGQIITTSAEVTLDGGLVRESHQYPLNSGLGIILICPEIFFLQKAFKSTQGLVWFLCASWVDWDNSGSWDSQGGSGGSLGCFFLVNQWQLFAAFTKAVDGSEIRGENQVRLVVYPVIYMFFLK